MRVVVIGTGAAASFFAARLARAGTLVTLTGSWRAALEAVARDGITIEEPGGAFTAGVETAQLGDRLSPADAVLVLVKSHQTAAVAAAAAAARAPDGLVLTLQNGLGNRETLEAATGPGRVAVGVTLSGFTLLAPGRVRAIPGLTIVGDEPGLLSPTGPIVDQLRQAGIAVETTRDVERLLWRKLVANCAINAPSALLGVLNGGLLDGPGRATLEQAAREVGAVARARGLDLGADPVALALEVARRTATNRSSMLQDLDRGAPTEIDALCGAVVREGQRLGIPTPTNERLWRAIRERQLAGASA